MARWIAGGTVSLRRIYAASAAVLIAVALSLWLGESHELFFDVRMSSSTNDIAQLFFDIGHGYNEQDSSAVGIQEGPARIYRFRLPPRRIYSLRFDVLSHEGRVTILSARIVDGDGESRRTFAADDFGPRLDLRTVERSKTEVMLETVHPATGQALDPSAYIRNSTLDPKFRFSFLRPLLWLLFFLGILCLSVVVFRWITSHRGLGEQDFVFRAGVTFVLAVTFIHLASLPLMVSFDGMDYVRLANIPLSPSFVTEWRFLRTPLFPLSLKSAFWLGGEQPEAALLVTTLFGLGGVLISGATVRRIAGGIAGAGTLIVLVLYPVLVGYQHMLLSETGTFFWLALLTWSLVAYGSARNRESLWFASWIAVVIALGYYWRPTIQYLSPLIAIAYLLLALTRPHATRPYAELSSKLRHSSPRLVGGALIVVAGPWLLAYPWIHLVEKYAPGIAEGTVTAGMYKQVLVPPDDPLIGSLKSQYETVIKEDSRNGRLPLDGLSIVGRMSLLERMGDVFRRVGLIRLIRKYPLRYSEGVAKSMLFFLGVPHHGPDDENWNFSRAIFGQWPSSEELDGALGWDRSLVQFRPVSYSGGGSLGRLLNSLLPWYSFIVLVSSIVSIGWLFLSIKRVNAVAFAITVIPLAFLLLHSFTLMAAARYGFPVYPLMMANLVTALSLTCQEIRRKRSRSANVENCSSENGRSSTRFANDSNPIFQSNG